MLNGSLTVTVDGSTVTFTYEIENAGSSPVEVEYRDGQKFDIAVSEDGDEVWRWSTGRMFTMALEQRELDPGETATYEATWEDASYGEYTATATCAGQGVDARAEAEFEV